MEITTRAPVRIGIIGCAAGRVRYGAALAAFPHIAVAALADPDAVAAKVWARELGGKVPTFTDTAALLQAPLALDAVLIASPLPDRADAVRQAAQAGRAMLCEAPLSSHLIETDEIVRIAAANNALLMPALPLRFDASLMEMTRQAEEGMLGSLLQARCEWTYPREAAQTLESARVLLEYVACQMVDIVRQWLGSAISISADIALPVDRRRDATLATLLITHERGQSTLRLASTASPQSSERYTLVGTQTTLERVSGTSVALTTPQLTRHRPDRAPEPLSYPEPDAEFSIAVGRRVALLRHFAECVVSRCASPLQASDLRAAQEIVAAAVISAEENIKMSLPLRSRPSPSLLPPAAPRSRRALPAPDHP